MDAAHLRIAITTNNLLAVDANFASAKQMVFYDVTREGSEFVDVVKFSRFGKKGQGGGAGGADGRCVMDDMGDDDGTGHDPLADRVELLPAVRWCSRSASPTSPPCASTTSASSR